MSERNVSPDKIAKALLAIPSFRERAIRERKMPSPVRLIVSDHAGNVLYEEKFELDRDGKIAIVEEHGVSQHFLPPLTVKLVSGDKVWEPELP